MGAYIVLTKLSARGIKALKGRPEAPQDLIEQVATLDGTVVGQYALLGEYDFCTIVNLPDNNAAHFISGLSPAGAARTILPAIDLPLFVRLLSQTTETTGPYHWQISWWARLVRPLLWWWEMGRTGKKYMTPFTVLGRENLDGFKGPAIFIGNHSSHLDSTAMMLALPPRLRGKLTFAGAADRWFLKGLKGMRRQGWWNSLVGNSFPLQRGGGRAALAYAEWLLDKGASIVIFPEGTRSSSGKMGRFRVGPALLAIGKDVPVVPLYFEGLHKIRPKGSKALTAGPATAIIGQPIRFAPGTNAGEATHTLYKAVEALRRQVHKHHDSEDRVPLAAADQDRASA